MTAPGVTPSPSGLFRDVLRSELHKLRSVRSTYWTLLAAVAANIVLAALAGAFLPGELSEAEKGNFDIARVSLLGIHLSQIAFGVLGVLLISSEYSTGLIRVSLAAVPRRRTLLTAKAIVLTSICALVGIGSSFGAFLAFQALNTDAQLTASLGDPGVFRAVTGGGLYLAGVALLGLGVGAAVRASSGAIAALLGLLFVPPILLQLLPRSWQTTVEPYVPMDAGSGLFALRPHAGSLGPWTGFGVFLAYAAVAVATGLLVISQRDA